MAVEMALDSASLDWLRIDVSDETFGKLLPVTTTNMRLQLKDAISAGFDLHVAVKIRALCTTFHKRAPDLKVRAFAQFALHYFSSCVTLTQPSIFFVSGMVATTS